MPFEPQEYGGGSARGVFTLDDYGADPTGVNDSTAAILAAKAAALAYAGGRGIVLVPPGTYRSDPLSLGGCAWKGYGWGVSTIKANAGTADFVTNNGASTAEMDTRVEDLAFDCSSLTGTARGFVWAESLANTSGPTLFMKNVRVHHAPGDGIDTSASGGALADCHYYSVISDHHAGNGWVLGSDAHHFGCIAALNGLAGFTENGKSSWTLDGCKSYGNGSVTASSGYGYHFKGQSPGASMSGCHAQDNFAAGILFDSGTDMGIVASDIVCDSNSRRGAGSNAAVEFFSATGVEIEFVSADRHDTGVNFQLNALKFTASTGNVARCTAHYATAGAVGNWILSQDAASTNNTIILGLEQGVQAPVFAAALTPDVPSGGTVILGALTGNITINAPTNPHVGSVLTFLFTQDATGGRIVTWNAAFVFQVAWSNTSNTAGKRSMATFIYNGTAWVCTSPVANVWF